MNIIKNTRRCFLLCFETVRKYRVYLRRIIRHAKPGACPKEPGKRPHEKERVGVDDSELDVEGSLWRFFHETYRPLRMAGRAEVSAMHYVFTLRRLARQFGRSVLVTDLSNELVAGHLQWMLDNGLSAFTANSVRGDLLALWRLAHKRHLVATSPDVDKLPTPKRQPRAWSLDELGRIFDACQTAKAWYVEGASRQLGHSSEAMTKRYIDPRFLQSRDATEFLPRPKRSNS